MESIPLWFKIALPIPFVLLFALFIAWCGAAQPNAWAFGETASWRIVKVNEGYTYEPYRVDERRWILWYRATYTYNPGSISDYQLEFMFKTVEEARRAIERWERDAENPTPSATVVEVIQ